MKEVGFTSPFTNSKECRMIRSSEKRRRYFQNTTGVLIGENKLQKAEDFKALYPMWSEFKAIRRQQDPKNVFLNEYLDSLMNDA